MKKHTQLYIIQYAKVVRELVKHTETMMKHKSGQHGDIMQTCDKLQLKN